MLFNLEKRQQSETGIYQIQNSINGKIYIGSTANSFRGRYHQHLSAFRKSKAPHLLIYRAFAKYGEFNFTFSILEICSKNECIEREQYFIDKYKPEYNLCPVAGSLLNYKHPVTAKTRTVKGGQHHSAKKIKQYSIDGVYLQTFNSIIEACSSIGIKSKSNLVSCCKGNLYSIKGFRWSYEDELLENLPNNFARKNIEISYNGIVCCIVNSQVKAVKFIQLQGFPKCSKNMVNVAVNKNKSVNGFTVKRINL